MSLAREKAITFALGELERDVLMGARGDLRFDRHSRSLLPHGFGFNIWDCSGLICGAILAAGGPDLRGSHNAQLLHDGCGELAVNVAATPGDLVFYGVPDGPERRRIVHVVMWLAGGHCISADGATWGVSTLEQARAARCKVRLHSTVHYRTDCPYVVVRRNLFLDAVDLVSR